jgi:hypothetical protein
MDTDEDVVTVIEESEGMGTWIFTNCKRGLFCIIFVKEEGTALLIDMLLDMLIVNNYVWN